MYTNRPYFDSASSLLNTYNLFMDNAFQSYSGMGEDAKIRSEMILHKDYINDKIKWKKDWNSNFTNEDKRTEIHKLYYDFLRQVSWELNLIVDKTAIPKMPDLKPTKKQE